MQDWEHSMFKSMTLFDIWEFDNLCQADIETTEVQLYILNAN